MAGFSRTRELEKIECKVKAWDREFIERERAKGRDKRYKKRAGEGLLEGVEVPGVEIVEVPEVVEIMNESNKQVEDNIIELQDNLERVVEELVKIEEDRCKILYSAFDIYY